MPRSTATTEPQEDQDAGDAGGRGNRGSAILRAATELFASRGFDATSMRDVAAAAAVQPASLYYHFASKESLLLAVVEPAARDLAAAIESASTKGDPWRRLEAACAVHLEALLNGEGAVRVLATEIPSRRDGELQDALLNLRRDYEKVFRELIDALPLPPRVDRKYLRLTLLGAINWTLIWYRPGDDAPEEIATKIIKVLRQGTR